MIQQVPGNLSYPIQRGVIHVATIIVRDTVATIIVRDTDTEHVSKS